MDCADRALGPCIVSTSLVPDVSKLHMRGIKNGKVMQNSGLESVHLNLCLKIGC